MPDSLKNRIFYDRYNKHACKRRAVSPGASEEAEASSLPSSRFRRKTEVSTLVSKFTRDLYSHSVDTALQGNSSEDSQQDPRRIIRQVLEFEETSFRSREEIAEKNILTSIQKQKYG